MSKIETLSIDTGLDQDSVSNEAYYDKNGVLVRPSILKDIVLLKDHLRQSDIDEMWDSNNLTPVQALTYGHYMSSVSLTIELDKKVVGMFGIVPIHNKAIIWMLGSNDIGKVARKTIRDSKFFIDSFLEIYPLLFNYVSIENKASVRWLEFLGAEIDSPKPYSKEGKLFRYFQFHKRIIHATSL